MPFPSFRLLYRAIAYLAILTLPAVGAKGQEKESYSLLLRGTSMELALEELVRQTRMDLVYSSDLIKGKRVYCSKRDVDPENLLRCILEDSGIDFIQSSSGTYILINALKKPPLFGDLAGSITDLDTGAPLPYANVLLADGTSGTSANQDGFFSFKSLISGLHRVVVTYVGYETLVDSVWIAPGERSRVNIALKSSETPFGPIVIDGLEQRLPSGALGRNSLRDAELAGMSNLGTPDVMRGASKLAGVSVQQPLAGVQIQGGLGNEHVTLLDGVPIRNPVTLGRYLSAFSPLALNRMTVHKAGYSVAHGSHLTGVIALDQDLASANPYSASLMLDPVSLNGRVKGRFQLSEGREGVVMGAIRTSNWDVYQDRSVQALLKNWNGIDPFIASLWSGESVTPYTLNEYSQEPLVSFSDIHFASKFKLSPFHNVQGSVYRASNRIKSESIATNDLDPLTNDLFVITDDQYTWLNWAGQIKHSWLLGAQSALSTQLKGSRHNSRYRYGALNGPIANQPSSALIEETAILYQDMLANSVSSFERNFIRELTLSSTLSHSFSPFHHTDLGFEANWVTTRFVFENAFVDPIQHDISTSNLAGFIQDQIALNAYTNLEPGLRLTYVPVRNTFYAEPRLAIRFDGVNQSLGNYALRLAGGVYRQFINQFELTSFGTTSAAPSILFWLPLDGTLSPPRAYHLAFDVLVTPGIHWALGLETFMKWQRVLTLDYATLQDVPFPEAPASSPQELFIDGARGRSYGMSLQLERTGAVFNVRAGYDYIRVLQQFPDRFDDALMPVPWNSPHQVSIDTRTKLTDSFTLEANWTSQWGREWALRRAYYDFLAFRNLPLSLAPYDLQTPLDHDLPFYQRLDIGLTFSIPAGRVKSDIQLFMTNVLGRENVFDQALSPVASGARLSPRTLPGRHFTLSVRVDY